jgi:hypothetical protein
MIGAVRDRAWGVPSFLLLAGLLGVMLATFLDYGITWDEGVQNRYGRRIVRWYATLGADARAVEQNDLYLYGGLFELVVQGAQRVSGLGVYENRHLVNTLFGFAGFVGVWGLGRRLGGGAAGFLAVLFLALTPGYYGHVFANPKDLPLASLFVLSAWAILRAGDTLPRPGWPQVLGVGVVIGLTAGVRVAGLALFGYAAVAWLGRLWLLRGGAPARAAERLREAGRVAVAWLGAVAVGWTVMVALWPWAQLDPLGHPPRALRRFAHFWNPQVLWEGRLVAAEELPRSYLPKMLLLTLPELYFVAALLGVTALAVLLRRRPCPAPDRGRLLEVLWVAALALLPVAWAVWHRTPLYNGYRHVLFVVPFLAVLAALAAAAFLRAGGARPVRAAGALALVASLGLAAADSVALHPYQYVFFNRVIAGGLPRAAERYDTDYWNASYAEGIDWMVGHYSARGLRGPVRVSGFSAHVPFHHRLASTEAGRALFEVVALEDDPHLVFVTTGYRALVRPPGRVVHTVRRQGATLLSIYEARPPE